MNNNPSPQNRSVVFSGVIVYETAQLSWTARAIWAWALLRGKELRLDVREIVIHNADARAAIDKATGAPPPCKPQ